ncbi:hypothetical protein [Capybara microvirus Cap3_SP_320]|nr:hypothetical protein [Capybara microvirus Cap3_SP_320]
MFLILFHFEKKLLDIFLFLLYYLFMPLIFGIISSLIQTRESNMRGGSTAPVLASGVSDILKSLGGTK